MADLVVRSINVAGPTSNIATTASTATAAATDVVLKGGLVTGTATASTTVFGVSKLVALVVGATLGAMASAGIIAGLVVGLQNNHDDHADHLLTTVHGNVQTVYLAAEEVLWNYAPYNINNCTGLPFGDVESIFMIGENQEEGSNTIGGTYHKRIWRQYTNADYTEQVPVPSEWHHKGFFGPVIRVAVGDTLKVYVKNKSRFPVSFHPLDFHLMSITVINGTNSSKAGSMINSSNNHNNNAHNHRVLFDTLTIDNRNSIPPCDTTVNKHCTDYDPLFSSYVLDTLPDETMIYTYHVPASAGPSTESGTTDTVARLYQSLAYDAHELSLSGIIIVSAAGYNGYPSNSNVHELVSLFSVSNENDSPYLDLNIVDFILRPRYMHAMMNSNNPSSFDERATEIGSPIFHYDTVEPEQIVMALYQAAAEALEVPDDTVTAMLNNVSYFQSLVSSAHVNIAAIDNVPLGIVLHTSTSLVDTTSFVATYGQFTVEAALAPLLAALFLEDPDFSPDEFEESNMMHSLNGIMYCNHEPMMFPEGSVARWHGGVIGTEVDMHTLHWHGNVLLYNGHRTDAIQLLPRSIASADMHTDNPGTWLYHCHVTDHLLAGMLSFYTVIPHTPLPGPNNLFTPTDSTGEVVPPSHIASQITGTVRHYYIAAEPELWNFTSETGYTDCSSTPGSVVSGVDEEDIYTLPVATKVRYVEYTDATFTTRKERTPEWAHLEIMGPIIRGEVGDTLKVTFLNRSPRPFSVHPHGILYRKDSEGAPYHDGTTNPLDTSDNNVMPNSNWTHTWFVPESAGPGPADGDSIVWLYHGHVHEAEDENIGLVGAIIITARGKATSATELRPRSVDREFVLLFKVFEPVHIQELENFTGDWSHSSSSSAHHHRQLMTMDDEAEHPHMFTINGKIFCGVPNLSMYVGERVRWYLVSLGNEIDVHHSSFAGASLLWKQHRVNGVPLLAGTMHQADMVPEMPGHFLIFDGSRELHGLGTEARYTVLPPPNPVTPSYPSPAYTYYIGAQEIEWDYIGPSDSDSCVPEFAKPYSSAFAPEPEDSQIDAYGTDLNRFPEGGRIFVRRDDNFIGRIYKKAVYRSYTDATFTTGNARTSYLPPLVNTTNSLRGSIYNLTRHGDHAVPVDDDHLGLLGPIIRGAVGQSIRVVFKNLLPDTSPLLGINLVPMHALQIIGFRVWNSTSESWMTMDARTAKLYAVANDETVEYTFYVPVSAGPGPRDPSSIVWAYSSSIDPTNHLYAGLSGAIIVSKDPSLVMNPDVDREFVISMMISDENKNPYLQDNIDTYTLNASAVDTEDPDFQEANLKHAFNGRLFCNLPGLTARVGEKVRWHMLAMGGPLDFHTPTFQGGASVVYDGGYRPTLDIYPGMGLSVDGSAESIGLHMLECGVNDHWLAGMRALFYVQE